MAVVSVDSEISLTNFFRRARRRWRLYLAELRLTRLDTPRPVREVKRRPKGRVRRAGFQATRNFVRNTRHSRTRA